MVLLGGLKMTKVYQAQVWRKGMSLGGIYEEGEHLWQALSTKSGGTICNTLGGARSKLSRIKTQRCRVVEFTLSNPVVIEERNFE